MWEGGGGGGVGGNEDEESKEQNASSSSSGQLSRLAALTAAPEPDAHNRLAALASAAYANTPGYGDATPTSAAASLLSSRYDQGYDQYSLLYPSQATVEALRRHEEMRQRHQEEMRQQALYLRQHHHATFAQHEEMRRQEMQELEYARQRQLEAAELELAEMRRREQVLAASRQAQQESVLEAVAAPRIPVKEPRHKTEESDDEEKSNDGKTDPTPPAEATKKDEPSKNHAIPPRGKPEAMATAMAAARVREDKEGTTETTLVTALPAKDDSVVDAQAEIAESEAPVVPTPKKKTRKRKASTSPAKPRKKAAVGVVASVEDPVPPITQVEYENVEALIEQFCKVPLLSEFSRPVSLLHPELFPKYAKIVTHPIDLGHVCRAIRRRQYKNTRAIQLDMWRIFANCIKYHTSPSNKDNAVPYFVSIALHLRDYFNALWQEYMIPSDPPPVASPGGTKSPTTTDSRNIFSKREKDRKSRIATTSATVLSVPTLQKTVVAIERFIEDDGRVDKLDIDPIFNDDDLSDEGDMDEVVENLRKVQRRLSELAVAKGDYGVEDLQADLRRCYSGELFESKPSLRIHVGHRIDRLLGKIVVNIFEANSRGVNQSSIWGCMAAAIWARESAKKPYWPALVLGIMAPDDQKEDWHATLTERNERRLPEKLRTALHAGKRKAELAIRRQNTGAGTSDQNSFFLVEFMGTHEFIWVKESDMIETFDPDIDPNLSKAAGNVTKKKRSSRSADVLGSKTYTTALEEGRWALEEFELQLNDTCGDLMDEDEEDEQESNYSYAVLCQSDDEADVEDAARHSEIEHKMSLSEIEEANELLATDGLLDLSVEGRKKAKKRAADMKKQKTEAIKSQKALRAKKTKTSKAQSKKSHSLEKGKEAKRERRELEKRRKKRTRDRERVLKEKSKRKKLRPSEDDSKLSSLVGKTSAKVDKSERASAIVKAYLMGVAKEEELKPLGFSGVMALPAAQIDSTGLLGMALAFRAAAGELDMPESSDPASKKKPWEAIDVNGPTTAKEREENLLKKKSLLEEEIKRVKAATQRRRELTVSALAEKALMEEKVAADERVVRESLIKKPRKKPVKTKERKVAVANTESEKRNDMEIDVPMPEEDEPNDTMVLLPEATNVSSGNDDGSAPTETDKAEEEQKVEGTST